MHDEHVKENKEKGGEEEECILVESSFPSVLNAYSGHQFLCTYSTLPADCGPTVVQQAKTGSMGFLLVFSSPGFWLKNHSRRHGGK